MIFDSNKNKLLTWIFHIYKNHCFEMTRLLTIEEIEDIISCIKPNPRIPEEIDICNKENVRSIMRKHLAKIKIYPEKIPALKEETEKYYLKTQISAGEMVGVLAATSIGEPTTQLALNSFHSSGISKSSMTTGVPRMQALLNTYKSKDDAGMYLFLKDVDNTNIRDIRSCCMSNYEYKTLKDVISSLKVVEVKKIKDEAEYLQYQEVWDDWHDYYDLLVSEEYKKSKYCIMIKLSKLEMYVRNKTLGEIADSIQKLNENIYPICSGEEECIILVYVNSSEIKSPHEIIGLKKSSSKTKSTEDFDIEGYITDENKDYYYASKIVVPLIYDIYLCGIKDIEACYYEQNTGSKTWKIETKGSNLREVLNHPKTDHTKTYSSDIWEIFEVFGIEAARSFLITEFNNIVNVSKRHVIQLVNMMTFFGVVRGANRHGVNGNQVKALSKITFEEPLKHLKKAAEISDVDYCNNISAQLIIGKTPRLGTGVIDLYLDMNKIMNSNIQGKEEVKEEIKEEVKEDVKEDVKESSNSIQNNTRNVEIKYNKKFGAKKNVIMKDEVPRNTKSKSLSSIDGTNGCVKTIGKIKSRIFNVDENNLPIIKEKNVEFF